MPFQSEKQRRYLWANEPEIARDWADTYGSRVEKDTGGIMDAWGEHATATEAMKLMNEPDYHQKAGYNFMQNFPNVPEWLANALATGYQYGSEGYKALKGGTDFSDAMARAKEESRLNKLGIQGSGFDMGEYENFMQNYNTANEISSLPRSSGIWDAIKNEFGGTAEAAIPDDFIENLIASTGETAEDLYDSNFRYVDQSIPGINDPRIPGDEAPDSSQRYSNFNQERFMGSPQLEALQSGIGKAFATDDTDDDLKALSYAVEPPEQQSVLTNFLDRILPNRTKLTPADRRGNEAFLSNQMMSIPSEYRNVGIDNTGRMVGGLFAGKNAPGSSMFGSANVKEMAQKWAQKNQHRQYKTPKMQAKQEAIINIATGGRDPDQGNTVTGHGKSGMGRDRSELMARGGLLRRGYSTGGISRLLPGKYE